mmetsp:Transcript_14061/g.30454  ORF Transcript_14061/g.30454 Transcript_14061/m.30454 type:complete len:324 (-) Transcript_14061:176-1147(-)
MAMFFFRQGLYVPLVTSPITLPSGPRISLCWRAGAPLEMNPTRFLLTPSASCFLMTSPPRKSNAVLRLLPTHQARPASMGVMSSLRSLPYRHRPASRRRLSRAPRPASLTALLLTRASASCTAWVLGTLISNPSSPVYPVLVTQTGMPFTSKRLKFEKYIFERSSFVRACRVGAAAGPCRASRARSSCTVMLTFLPLAWYADRCLLRWARSLSLQPALTTMYSSSAATLVMTVSSMMPPFSFVKQLKDPVPSFRPAMSPTTRVSRKEIASGPLSVKPHICATSNKAAPFLQCCVESIMLSLYWMGIDQPANGTILPPCATWKS